MGEHPFKYGEMSRFMSQNGWIGFAAMRNLEVFMQEKAYSPCNRLEHVLAAIHDAEHSLLQVESCEEFQILKRGQKLKYQDVLSGLRGLIHDLEQDTAQEQLACVS